MLQQYHALNRQSDANRLYLSGKTDGRMLIRYHNQFQYFFNLLDSKDQFLKLTSNWHVTQGKKSIHQKAHQYCNETGHDIQQSATMRKLPWKFPIKSARINRLEAKLKRNNMHGTVQFAKYVEQYHVDKDGSN